MPSVKTGTGTINRLLSRREKDGSSHSRQKSREKSSDGRRTRPLSTDSILSLLKADPQKKLDKEQAAKIESIQKQLNEKGYTGISEEQISYALASKHANGDVDQALELVVLFQESVEGVIKPYNPSIRMRGAENREGVTCYLDSLLFSMFARLTSFEPILYATFEDEPRRRLSTLIRLWVNMLRTGKLIQTDITEHLQDALAACGWKEAAGLRQQDVSEAFHQITEILQLPLLTLKMDIYHTGLEDATDDHKFVHERLLEVAVPEEVNSGEAIQLEDCLEEFFNNRVEVVRHLERSNTIKSGQSPDSEKGGTVQQIEISELASSSPTTPIVADPASIPLPPSPTLRHRAESIIRTVNIPDKSLDEDEDGEPSTPKIETENNTNVLTRQHSFRKGAVRKEVLMPAWQFFNLIPWYTKHAPANDAEVAAHFSQTQPVLGICLKRYSVDKNGRAHKRRTFIDIPLDIRLPHFVPDQMMADDGPLMGNFKLSLQAVICHRGYEVNAGHYISFIRGTTSADGDSTSATKLTNGSAPPVYPVEKWIKFDDCATPRVSTCDIEKALKEETPYLLFYQVQPTYGSVPSLDPEASPPSYNDSRAHGIQMKIDQASPAVDKANEATIQQGYFDGAGDDNGTAVRFSSETDRPRSSLNLLDDRRASVATEGTLGIENGGVTRNDPISAPATPSEETTAQRMSRAAARFTKSGSKTRPSSQSGDSRISATFSRLALMRSKESLNKVMQVHKTESLSGSDGALDSRKSSSIEEATSKASIQGSPTKKEKTHKRDKSKGAMEMLDQLEHRHLHKGSKSKDKDVPDRECSMM